MSPSDRQIIELNIEHFHTKLQSETDPSTRRTIIKLLREEEDKLAKIVGSVGVRRALPPLPGLTDETD